MYIILQSPVNKLRHQTEQNTPDFNVDPELYLKHKIEQNVFQTNEKEMHNDRFISWLISILPQGTRNTFGSTNSRIRN